ncbi:GLUT4 regulating protein TUG-domain-containing protein [Ochromonadaceae sp. CCMP2298]|nr:GLUT4 regulating protein TUG-domain-containing protein [Ochromonadaceae sp. CCMP2298]
MSVTVIYEGQRRAIKCAPNALMQSVLAEAALHFNVDAGLHGLLHKKTLVDASQPFRFSGLSNNTQLDLVPTGAAASTCRIALAVEGASVTEVVPAQLTLTAYLQRLVDTGKLPADLLQRSPELIYLRSSYSGVGLGEQTLAGLGLAG